MQDRAAKSKRVLAAQQQLHRVEQWKLADLQGRLAELNAAQIDTISALNGSELHGLFIEATARRLRSLAEEAQRVMLDKDKQSIKTSEHAGRVRAAERLAHALQIELDREIERKELMEIIDQYLTNNRTSLP
jgi:hypothetical protein